MPDFQLFFFSIEMNGTQTFFVGIRPRNQDKKNTCLFFTKTNTFCFFSKKQKNFSSHFDPIQLPNSPPNTLPTAVPIPGQIRVPRKAPPCAPPKLNTPSLI